MTRLSAALAAFMLSVVSVAAAEGQNEVPPASRPPGSIFWFVGGAGLTVARAGCQTCDRAGVFTNSPNLQLTGGFRVSPRVDAGVELSWVGSKLEEGDKPIRTTFIMGVGQFRPWIDRGFLLKAGMGIGFVGNGLYSPIGPELAPPFTSNTLALVYGAGWVFRRERRFTLQVHTSHHVAALGELTTTTGTSVKNVVGNYWTVGTAFVIR